MTFFNAGGRAAAFTAYERCKKALGAAQGPTVKAAQSQKKGGRLDVAKYQGQRWLTRRNLHIDRLASAWLIKQFIDKRPRFYFVAEGETVERAIPFDMFGAEFTHHGEDCTFETILKQFGLAESKGLREIAEIVHDIDLKDDKFHRLEAAGLNAIIDGLSKVLRDDRKLLQQTCVVFDGLYALLNKESEKKHPRRVAESAPKRNDRANPTSGRRWRGAPDTKREEVAIGDGNQMPSWREVFLYFLMLGFVNIGGPVAQITMMYNHMVERRHWLSKDRFVKIMAFCHMLPGPEALQLAIYVGYLKRKLVGGVLAGLTFILPGAVVMIALSWLYVRYGSLPQVNNVLYVLKPAVLGIISAGILKLGRASIRSVLLAALLIGAFVGMRFVGINFLLILILAGLLNLLIVQGWPTIWRSRATLPTFIGGLIALQFTDSRWFQMAWLFFKTGLFSFWRRLRVNRLSRTRRSSRAPLANKQSVT